MRLTAGCLKAAAIRRILEDWGIAPDAAIYVGDGAADMLAARKAGVLAAGAAWAQGARVGELKDARADVIFTDAADFLAWLDRQTRPVGRG